MNHWSETAAILARLGELEAEGRGAALATVVRIVGSAYRRPGAKLLIEADGRTTLGSVSGGCLEADVREVAREVVAEGAPRLRHYDTGDDDSVVWGLGLGCNGQVDVFVQPATSGSLAGLAPAWRSLLGGESAIAAATVVEGEGAGAVLIHAERGVTRGTLGDPELDGAVLALAGPGSAGAWTRLHQVRGRTVFVEREPPPPHLLVLGAGDDAQPLVAYAAEAGFRVTVVDHRPALLAAERFRGAGRVVLARPEDAIELPPAARTFAVVKTHSLAHDREWARRLLATVVPYVGLLGPRLRAERILHEIGHEGDERVFGPVGLDLGAEGAHQVALAMVAELLTVAAGRAPAHLRRRGEAIHADGVGR